MRSRDELLAAAVKLQTRLLRDGRWDDARLLDELAFCMGAAEGCLATRTPPPKPNPSIPGSAATSITGPPKPQEPEPEPVKNPFYKE